MSRLKSSLLLLASLASIQFASRGVLAAAPAAPQNIVARVASQCVVLHWDAVPDPSVTGYYVFRRTGGTGNFLQLNSQATWMTGYADTFVRNDTSYSYYVVAVNSSAQTSDTSAHITAVPHDSTDDAFLDFIQETAVDFFWYEANPANGLIKDRSTPDSPCSIASVGFGLTAICIGIDHGWIPQSAGRDRVLTTLRFLYSLPEGNGLYGYAGYNGIFFHFLDMKSGLRTGSSELSSIDTALLLAGVVYAKQYFSSSDSTDVLIRAYADSLYYRANWRWMQATGNHGGIYMQWTPESGFATSWWTGYCEAMIMNTLAAGSPTHPAIGQYLYLTWTSGYSWQTQYGYTYVNFPPLFGHQYSHCWIDYRSITDPYMSAKGITYFENSRRATLANRAYCAADPGHFAAYSDSVWGLTACDGPAPAGYQARGAPPEQNDDGTIAPTAAGGSIAFTPTESIAALRAMFDSFRANLVTPYGLGDAFNISKSWYDDQNIGIDQGPIAIMIENYRRGSIWSNFMSNADIQRGLSALYLTLIDGVKGSEGSLPSSPRLQQNYPNPFNPVTTIDYSLPARASVRLTVDNILGEQVALLVNRVENAGDYSTFFDGSRLASGVYLLRLNAGGTSLVRKLVLVK